jgi:hypothetical protein
MELSFPAAGPGPRPIQPTPTDQFARRETHYADQNKRDYDALQAAVSSDRLTAETGQ